MIGLICKSNINNNNNNVALDNNNFNQILNESMNVDYILNHGINNEKNNFIKVKSEPTLNNNNDEFSLSKLKNLIGKK